MNEEAEHFFNSLSLLKEMESMRRDLDNQQKQIGRIIQCIGELELNKQQRAYLHRAIYGEGDYE